MHYVFSFTGDSDFGAGFDANGSNESFELVTEENNGDGSKRQGTEGRDACRMVKAIHFIGQ